MTRSSTTLLAAGALLAPACLDEASVGKQPGDCFEGMECVEVTLPDHNDMSSWGTDVEQTLSPSWVRTELDSVPIPAPAATNNYGESWPRNLAFLATGVDGALWTFMAQAQDDMLRAYRLSETGDILDFGAVATSTLSPTAGAPIQLATASSHPQGPVVLVNWATACPSGEAEEDPGDCVQSEVLVFGETADAEPVRIRAHDAAWDMSFYQADRTPDGDAIVVSGWGRVRAFGLDGTMLWETVPPSSFGTLYGITSATLSPNERVVHSIYDRRISSHTWRRHASPAPFTLFEVGAGIPKLLRVSLSPGLSLTIPPPTVRYDPEGRTLFFLLDGSGDLMIARSDMRETTNLVHFRRDHYAVLTPEAIAIDPSGDLYISLHPGARSPAERTPLICRVRNSFDDVHCVKVDGLPVSMQAPQKGVIYALSVELVEPEEGQSLLGYTVSPKGLQRYDFPD